MAQRFSDVEPQFLRLQRLDASSGVYFEGTREETSYKSGVSGTYQRFFEGPVIGFGMDGWIYHPNLLQFSLSADGALGYTEEKIKTSSGDSINHTQFDYLGNLYANGIFLANKPYRSTVSAGSSRIFRDYDFFNRATVDNRRYGFSSGYSKGPVPVSVSFSRYEEDASGFNYTTSLRRTTVNLDAHNDRPSGGTTASYTFSDDERIVSGEGGTSTSHSFRLSDREVFGQRKNIELDNSAAFVTRDFAGTPSEDIAASSHLSIEHRPNLTSTYDANYFHGEAGTGLSENYDVGAGVQHKLYQSLTSGLRVQALRYSTESPVGNSENMQYSVTWSEAYTKRLGSSARLSISGSLGFTHGDQTSHSDFRVVGEPHTFGSSGPVPDSFLLNAPNVKESTIQVFDEPRTIRYQKDVDYSISTVGAQTLIRLIEPNPSGLTRDSRVLVDYEAASQGTGSYDGLFSSAQVRLDLLNGMWGVYGRYENSDHTATGDIVVQDVTSLAFGVDFSRKWLRAGAEYLIYDSTFAAYTSARAYQALSFTPDDVSTLNFEFSEAWSDYKMGNRTEEYFSFISRYHRALTRHLGLDVESGIRERLGPGVDQTLAAFRSGIRYVYGKMSVHANYDFEYQLFQKSEERTKQMFSIRIKRTF